MFEEIFAVSDDNRAVRFDYSGADWRPLTPSKRLAQRVLRDTSLSQLEAGAVERVFEFIDPPSNFSLEWRARRRCGDWLTATILIAPAIPFWYFWEDIQRWTNDYGAIVGTAVFIVQVSLLAFRQTLTEGMVSLAASLDRDGSKRSVSFSPQEATTQTESRPVSPAADAQAAKTDQRRVGLHSTSGEPSKTVESADEDPLAYAILALRSDAYSYQARQELIERFALGSDEAEEIVRSAKEKIRNELEARNPETMKSLGISSGKPQTSSVNQQLSDVVERGQKAGMDPERLESAFSAITPEELKAIFTVGAESAKQGYLLNTRLALKQAEAFGLPPTYYVKHRGRIFVYELNEDSWSQSFKSDVPSDAMPISTGDLFSLIFDETEADRTNCLASFNRLQVNAVPRDQVVRLRSSMPDGEDTSVRLHAARWASILSGLPLILKDEEPSSEIEWHFNDYPGSAFIYRARKENADPRQLVMEVSWEDLGREVLESQ